MKLSKWTIEIWSIYGFFIVLLLLCASFVQDFNLRVIFEVAMFVAYLQILALIYAWRKKAKV